MASYTEANIKSKMSWANSFSRMNPDVLDRTSLWGSFSDAQKYAKGDPEDPDSRNLQGVSYIGQPLTVYEDDTVSFYLIGPDRNLMPVNGAEEGAFTANTYDELVAYATDKTFGKIVSLNQTDGSHESGIYVVSGPGAVSRLGLIADGDTNISTDIASIKSRLNTLESDVCWSTDNETKPKIKFWRGSRASYNYLKEIGAINSNTRYAVTDKRGENTIITEYLGSYQITVPTGQLCPVLSVLTVDEAPTVNDASPNDRYLVGSDETGYNIYEFTLNKDNISLTCTTQIFDAKWAVRVIDRGMKNYFLIDGKLGTYDDVDCGEF